MSLLPEIRWFDPVKHVKKEAIAYTAIIKTVECWFQTFLEYIADSAVYVLL